MRERASFQQHVPERQLFEALRSGPERAFFFLVLDIEPYFMRHGISGSEPGVLVPLPDVYGFARIFVEHQNPQAEAVGR